MWVEDCPHDPRADSKECSRAGSRIVTFRFPPIISDSTLIQCNTMDNDPQLNESSKGEIGAIYRLKQEHDLRILRIVTFRFPLIISDSHSM